MSFFSGKTAVCIIVALLMFPMVQLSAADNAAASKAQPSQAVCNDCDNDTGEEGCFTKAGRALLWYIPQRLSDLMDMFTCEVGIGEVGVGVKLTRYATFGAGIGSPYMLGWSIYDQHGIYSQKGWYADIMRYNVSEVSREEVCGHYVPFFKSNNGLVDIDGVVDGKAEDPYAIGVNAAALVGVNFQFHPVELADFIAGFLFIDFQQDDKYQIHWFGNMF